MPRGKYPLRNHVSHGHGGVYHAKGVHDVGIFNGMGVDGLVQQPFVGKCTFGVLVVVGNVAEGSDGTFSGKIDEFPFASPIVWGT